MSILSVWIKDIDEDGDYGYIPMCTVCDKKAYQCSEHIIMDGNRELFTVGTPAFNYYDMKVGHPMEYPDHDGWFNFAQEDGSVALLNGQRICSISHAKKMGWL